MSVRDDGATHYYGDECPGGHRTAGTYSVATTQIATPDLTRGVAMPADRPVTPGTDIPDEWVRAYLRAERAVWRERAPKTERETEATDREATRAGLAAVVPLIRAQVAAEPGERVPIRCMRCDKPVSAPIPGDIVVRAWVECPECVARGPEQTSALLAAAPYREDTAEEWDWTIPTPSTAITPAVQAAFDAPVTVTVGGDFAEPDEDPADVQAAYEAGEKGETRRPTSEGQERSEEQGHG